MSLEKIVKVTGKSVFVPGDDIDTDRIIPARFMKCITFSELGQYFFYDVRCKEDGSPKEHPLNEKRFSNAKILLSGNNFGCGSSREHAPQALFRAGFRAVIAEGYAEIFFGNATQLGIPCISAKKEDIAKIALAIEQNPDVDCTIDLQAMLVYFGDQKVSFSIREGARQGLISGRWDPIADLQANTDLIDQVATKLPYVSGY